MIQINPLQSYIDGGARAAITNPPSASLVFDLPGRAIWVKGVKLKGTDHTYTFSHDNYISITNTPDQNNLESEDILIGINTTLLKQAIDTTYGIVNATTNGLAPMFSSANKATASAATTYNFLGIAGTTLKWYQLPWRNVRINTDNTDVLGVTDTDPLIIGSGDGISVTWDSTNKRIVITNSKPHVADNTDFQVSQYVTTTNNDYRVLFKRNANDDDETGTVRYASTLLYNPSTKILKINGNKVITAADIYVGATSSANATAGLVPAATSAQRTYFLRGDGTWLTIVQENTWRPIKVGNTDALGSGTNTGTLTFVAGTGITLGWDATNKKITITNSAPDLNHNTDRTGVKLGTVSGTQKTDSTLIIANSGTGLVFQGGTNLFKIGDGTNYIQVPITPSFTVTDKSANILTSLTTIATIAGTDIKAKITVEDKAATIGTSATTIATIGGTNITAKIASYSLSNHTHKVKINGSEKTITSDGNAVNLGNYLPLSGGTMVGTIDASADSRSGGGYHSGYANIILRGNETTGVSAIVFSSSKGDTSINRPSDCGFIQFHPYGVSATTTQGTNPTLNTSGESARLVIGCYNDADDLLWLQTRDGNALKHVVETAIYTIADSGNISNKAATIGTSSTTIATIAGVDITAKIASYAASNHTHPLSIAANSGTSSIALAASTKYKLTAGGSTYIFTSTPDEKVRQVPKTDNVNRPLMMINGGTSQGEQINTSMFSTGIYANASTNTIFATRIVASYGNFVQTSMRHIDAGLNSVHTDHNLYIGYGAQTFTKNTYFYYSTGTDGTDTITSRTHYATINSNGLYAHPRFGVNGQNTGYNLYVNGTSFFNNVVRIQYNTPNLYIRNTVDTSYSIIRLGSNSNENASYIFQNGPSRTDDGGANVMTIRNNVGVLRLQNRIHIDSTGRVYPEGTNSRRAGMYGVYDSTRLGHIWSMGTGYMISDNGLDPASLYGLAYFHTNWSNNATYNTNAANKTAVGAYAGNHQVGWFINGVLYGSIGDYIWSRNGFIKNGSNNNYVLLGGGGHKALSDFSMAHSHPYLPLAGGTMNSGAQIIVGSISNSSGNVYNGGIQLRERGYATTSLDGTVYTDGPGITFHWGGRWVHMLNMHSNDIFWDNNKIWHAGNAALPNKGTANRIAWYNGAASITSGSITTDGSYLGNVSYLSINTAHQTGYRLYVNGTSWLGGTTYQRGVIYLASGTTYYIDNSALGYLNDLRVDQTRLVDNWIGFYQSNNAGGSRYGYIQANANRMYFRKENGVSTYHFDFAGHVYVSQAVFANTVYANINGSSTANGISLYSNSDPMTYGIAFRGTGTYGTHGAVTSDWATYFTMSNTTNRGWIFRRGSTNVASIDGTGKLYLGYPTSTANPGVYWNPCVESASDGSDISAIYQIRSGVAGGTELRISQANDSGDVINIVSPYYIYLNSKRAFTINDSWLRINEGLGFSSGIYTGSSLVRSDNQLQVGSGGANFYANSSGNGYFSNTLGIAGTNTSYKLYVAGTAYIRGSAIYWGNGDARMTIYGVDTCCGAENVAFQTTFDDQDPLTSSYPTSYPSRAAILLQPRGGRVGINVAHDPSYPLHVGGDVGATHYYETSDIRLKHDISMLSKSIRRFRFNNDNKLYYGFIAQELETLHPELVDSSGEYKTVNYNSAICYYIAELENRVKELEEKIKRLELIKIKKD